MAGSVWSPGSTGWYYFSAQQEDTPGWYYYDGQGILHGYSASDPNATPAAAASPSTAASPSSATSSTSASPSYASLFDDELKQRQEQEKQQQPFDNDWLARQYQSGALSGDDYVRQSSVNDWRDAGYDLGTLRPDPNNPYAYLADHPTYGTQKVYEYVRGNDSFGDLLGNITPFDFTGLTGAAFGQNEGLLGLQNNLFADATGTKPDEWLMGERIGAGALNPVAGLGLQVGSAMRNGTDLDPEELARNYALSKAVGAGLETAAPYVSKGMDAVRKWLASAAEAVPAAPMEGAGMLQLADAGTSTTDVTAPSMPPAIPEPRMPPAIPDSTFAHEAIHSGGMLPLMMPPAVPMMPPAVPETDPTFGGLVPQGDSVPVPAPAQPTVSGADLQKYVKLAQTINSVLKSDGPPEDAPVRDENMSDEQYQQQLAEYLNIDLSAETLHALGLQPGTPEYTDYILAQADALIAQLTQGMDLESEDLAGQFRSKTREELIALQRALYVRGQLELRTGSGTYKDPATGNPEAVIGEGMFNPGVGAYQRGLARSVQDLGGMNGNDAVASLRGMLGRNTDFFGMGARREADFNRALLNEHPDEEELRRRGMLPSY